MSGPLHREAVLLLPQVDKDVLTDGFAITVPWGFDVDEISILTAFRQGSADLMVPFAHGEWLAAHLPEVAVHLEDGEGRSSVGIGAIDRMLDELRALADATSIHARGPRMGPQAHPRRTPGLIPCPG